MLLLSNGICFSQITEDFSDGELSNDPTWQGNIEDFIINESETLQLFAEEAGESFIYTSTGFGSPQLWEFSFRMEFNPSNANFTRIYLGLTDPDLDSASGYYLQAGESGSDDALQLYELIDGSSTLLATGTIGTIATDPAQARVQLSYTNDNTIILRADFSGISGSYEEEFEMSKTLDLSALEYFGLYTKYTATRVDKFFFDDIHIPDFSPPALSDLIIVDENNIHLCFNEPLMDIHTDQIEITPTLEIAEVTKLDQENRKIGIRFEDRIESGVEYTIQIIAAQDQLGNISDDISRPFTFISDPAIDELQVSELLFDPLIGGDDFVEIYNSSDKILSLKNISIANLAKDEIVPINSPDRILPAQYLAFTPNKGFLHENYQVLNPDHVYEQTIPSFNNADGNVSIIFESENKTTVLDSFDYSESQHFELLRDTEGVSLERLSFSESAQNLENWHSAASAVGFATPGYKNSNAIDNIQTNSMFELRSTTFSPNGDSEQDLLILNYQTDKPGFIADIDIFDANGHLVTQLNRSLLLSTSGFVQWDGINAEGARERVGVYILYIKAFHPDGDIFNEKLVFTLADFLD